MRKSYYITALLLGAIHTQAFAPLNLWWLQLLSLAGLFYLARQSAYSKQAACLGYLFGLGWFVSGFWWLYISMHIYGGMPAVLAGLAVLLLAAALAVFPALALWCTYILCAVQADFQKIRFWLGMLTTASIWGISEWLRGTVLTGFPWIASGYAHTDGPLSGYAALVGVYGVSAIAAWVSLLLSYLPAIRHSAIYRIGFTQNCPSCVTPPCRTNFVLSASACLAGTILRKSCRENKWFAMQLLSAICLTLIIGWQLQAVRFTQALPQPISVRLIQGNIPQNMKFDIANFYLAMQRYAFLITQAPADLIIAPETSFPIRLADLPADLKTRLYDFAYKTHSQILLGAISLSTQDQPKNSLVTLDGYEYSKSHLVPFGEFTPVGFDWFMRWLNMPLGNFSRGAPGQMPLTVKDTLLAPNICYEDLFGEEIAHNLYQHPANILVNASNIAWFGNTRALDQHLQIARFRSLETQLPTLRATNTGMTAWIDEYGKIRATLPRLTAGSLDIQVHGQSGITPFVRWGNTPFLIGSLLLGIGMLVLKRKYPAQ